jgi:NhaP-type Na+/H+ or K+/H+ antiporter
VKADSPLPLKPPLDPPKPRTPAPAWLAFLVAWLGLISLALAIAIPFLPGSRDPQAEITHAKPYPLADRAIPIALYTQTVTLFLGIIVFRQMTTEPRPLSQPLVAQRLQAWTGIALAFAGIIFVYLYVQLRGPGGHL